MKEYVYLFILIFITAFAKSQIDSLAGFDFNHVNAHLSRIDDPKLKIEKFEQIKRKWIKRKFNLNQHIENQNAQNFKYSNPNSVFQGNQPPQCTNIDFESGNFSTWTVQNCQLMTGGTDPWGNFPRVFPGGNFSVKIGDDWANTCDCTTGGICTSFARRQINVTPANNLLQLHLAFVVYNFPHTPADAANITLRIRNPVTGTYFSCPQFLLYYNGNTNQFVGLNGMFNVNFGGIDNRCETGCGGQCNVSYLPWSTINVDLNPFMGQTIEVEITTNWCAYDVDWAYAYLDMDCLTYNVSNGTCGSTLCAPAGFASYSWTFPNGATQTGSCVVPPVSGIYTVVAQPMIGCQNPSTFTMLVSSNFTTSVSSSSITCNGFSNGSATANVSGNNSSLSYTWLPSGGNAHTASNLSPGIYTVVVSDGSCVDSKTIQITQPPALSITAQSQSVTCNGLTNGGATVNLGGGLGSYTYTWTPSVSSSSVINNVGVGFYTVNASDINGCSISTIINIQEPSSLTLTASNQSITCHGLANGSATVYISGGLSGYSYSWNPAASNSSVLNNAIAGIYTVNVSDINGCSVSTVINIQEPSALTLTATHQSVTCHGFTDGGASVQITGGLGSYTYTWSPSVSNTSLISNVSAGIYTLNASDINGCPISTVIIIQEPTALSLTATNQSVSCYGYSDGNATVNVSGGLGGYTYNWTPAASNSSLLTNVIAGIYSVNVTDINGCLISTVINIVEPSPLTLTSSPDSTICFGNSINIFAGASGGIPGYTYNWSPEIGSNTAGPHALTLTLTSVYTVQAIDQNNCASPVNTINITVLPPLIANGYLTSVCDGSVISLIPNITSPGNGGPYTYSWSNGSTAQQINVTGNLSLGSPNIYSVSISDGCSIPGTTAVFTININPNPIISFSAYPRSGCVPLTVYYSGFSNGTNDSFYWDFDNGVTSNQPNFVTTYSNVGVYTPTLTVTTDKGCTTSSFAPNYINVYPYPVADFNVSSWTVSVLEPVVNFYNTSTGASTFTWSIYGGNNTLNSNQPNPTFYFDMAGTYTAVLEVQNVFGCYDFIHKLIYVDPEFHIYIPNTFTPNDDNVNDVFFPKGIGISEDDYRMLIFDRWGELIFESREFKRGWDGTGRDGKRVKQDVYIYKIYVKDIKGKLHEFVGHVNCIR